MKYRVCLIQFLILLTNAHFCFAEAVEWKKFGEARLGSRRVEFWSRVGYPVAAPEAPVIKELKKVFEADLLRERLPKAVGILVDGAWTRTSGYWSSTLQTPSGLPAVLINSPTFANPAERLRLIAHELTHLVHYAANPKEESWVREGLAMLVEQAVTGKLNPVLLAAKSLPETSLVASHDPASPDFVSLQENTAQYGHVLEYFHYLHRLCGGERFVSALFEQVATAGIATVEKALAAAGGGDTVCSGFKESFVAFSKARFTQSTAKASSYVWLTGLRAAVREGASGLPSPFPRYSSGAYKIEAPAKACEKGDHAWGERRCIRISF